jgi:glutamate formiminotransferase/formiminotetrahydrofolate cyclodeaminase
VPSSAELPLAELLSAVSDESPAPGAGSAAAWTGALAAALLEMAARFAGIGDAVERARALRSQLLASGEEELRSYEPVLAAARLDPSDPAREQRLREALSRASEAPLAIARSAAEVAELAAGVAARSKPALRGDAIAGVLLAEAASRSAARLVEINLIDSGGDPRLAEASELRSRLAAAREQVVPY